MWEVRRYATYYQEFSENNIQEKGTLRGATRFRFSPAVKNSKEAPGSYGELVVKMDTAMKGDKTPAEHKSRSTSSKPEHRIAYNGFNFDEESWRNMSW